MLDNVEQYYIIINSIIMLLIINQITLPRSENHLGSRQLQQILLTLG